eukprot:9059702-Pyramimonas_sp.AAC.1
MVQEATKANSGQPKRDPGRPKRDPRGPQAGPRELLGGLKPHDNYHDGRKLSLLPGVGGMA